MEIYIVKVYENGNRAWYQNDQRHRVGGPAIEMANGTRYWLQKGQLHRPDGPAVEWADGDCQWWIEGKRLTEKEFNQKTKKTACEDKTVIIDGVKYKLVKE